MKNKKLLALICASVLAVGALTACSSKEETPETPVVETPADETPAEEATAAELKDGTYRAEYDKEDSKGWKAFVEVTVEGGKMTAATFDYINAEGALKSADQAYNDKMKEISGSNPAEFTVALTENLIATQNPAEIDVVTGATSSTADFVTLATELMAQMQEGNTEVLTIAQPAE